MVLSATAKAPASTANLGSGFDVFGLGLDAFYDSVNYLQKKARLYVIAGTRIWQIGSSYKDQGALYKKRIFCSGFKFGSWGRRYPVCA